MIRLLNLFRKHRACIALERDRKLRERMLGPEYKKHREAAKKGHARRKGLA